MKGMKGLYGGVCVWSRCDACDGVGGEAAVGSHERRSKHEVAKAEVLSTERPVPHDIAFTRVICHQLKDKSCVFGLRR
jgi:hypothetical protein